jgi:hypothetical protein
MLAIFGVGIWEVVIVLVVGLLIATVVGVVIFATLAARGPGPKS